MTRPLPSSILSRAVMTTTILSSRLVTTVVNARHGEANDPVAQLQAAQDICREMLTRLHLAELDLVVALQDPDLRTADAALRAAAEALLPIRKSA